MPGESTAEHYDRLSALAKTGSGKEQKGDTVVDTAPRSSPHRVPKMSEMVAADIRTRILNGEFKPGESLASEAALMEEHGVSRPTLREAIRLLEAGQLISVRRGSHRGPVVRLPDSRVTAQSVAMLLQLRGATLADVYRFRMVFEPPAARMAAENATEDDIELLRQTLRQEAAALGDWALFTEVSWQFHTQFVALSGNVTMGVVTETLQRVSSRHADLALVAAANRKSLGDRSLKAHHKLVDLIAAGQGPEAERFWEHHMKLAGEVLLPKADRIPISEVLI
jgi:DNA-binding FadR family transcriptional regulator